MPNVPFKFILSLNLALNSQILFLILMIFSLFDDIDKRLEIELTFFCSQHPVSVFGHAHILYRLNRSKFKIHVFQ